MRKKDDKKITKITQAVIKLILKYGFQGTSMSRIAKEAGISPATLYIYYKNKDHMIHEIYHELRMNRYNYIINNIDCDMDPKKKMKIISKSYYNYIISHEEEFFFLKQFSSSPYLCKLSKEKPYNINLDGMLNIYKENGVIKDIDNRIIISLLFSPIEYIAEHSFARGSLSSQEEVDNIFDIVWKSITL